MSELGFKKRNQILKKAKPNCLSKFGRDLNQLFLKFLGKFFGFSVIELEFWFIQNLIFLKF